MPTHERSSECLFDALSVSQTYFVTHVLLFMVTWLFMLRIALILYSQTYITSLFLHLEKKISNAMQHWSECLMDLAHAVIFSILRSWKSRAGQM